MQLNSNLHIKKTQIQIPRIDLATEGLSLDQVAQSADISPEQLADSIERGWFPEGEAIDGRKLWHPHFLLALIYVATAEMIRGDLPETWPLSDRPGPFLDAQQSPSCSTIVEAWRSFPMDVKGTVSIAVYPEITKVYFSKSVHPSECWELQQVAEHFHVTVSQLRRSIEHGVFPDARLIDGRMTWHPGYISILTDLAEFLKRTGRLSQSWPVMPGNWGGTPTRHAESEVEAEPKAKRHFKKRKAA